MNSFHEYVPDKAIQAYAHVRDLERRIGLSLRDEAMYRSARFGSGCFAVPFLGSTMYSLHERGADSLISELNAIGLGLSSLVFTFAHVGSSLGARLRMMYRHHAGELRGSPQYAEALSYQLEIERLFREGRIEARLRARTAFDPLLEPEIIRVNPSDSI